MRRRTGQVLVGPDTLLCRTGADAAVRLAEAVGVLEAATVEGDTEDHLVLGRAGAEVVVEGLRSGDAVNAVGVDVGLVGGEVEPRASVVVSLEGVSQLRLPFIPQGLNLTIKFQ